jgi:hypothetical protein
MVRIRQGKRSLAVTAAFLDALACVALYFGVGMLLMVPGDPYHHEPYLKGRVLFGVLPTALGVVLVLTAGWLWSRASQDSLPTSLARSAGFCVCLLLLAGLVLIVVADLR